MGQGPSRPAVGLEVGAGQDTERSKPVKGAYHRERDREGRGRPGWRGSRGGGVSGGCSSGSRGETGKDVTGQNKERKRTSSRHSPAGEGGGVVPEGCGWDSFFRYAGSNGVTWSGHGVARGTDQSGARTRRVPRRDRSSCASKTEYVPCVELGQRRGLQRRVRFSQTGK